MAVPGEYGLSQGPQVTIRQIKKDSVDFVLSNVDLAYVFLSNEPDKSRFANSLRRIILAELPTVGKKTVSNLDSNE
jgi:DNA-directed RNA polymerase II subunit RPB3